MMTTQEKYMKEALKEAKKALAIDEVPIGCVIVKDGKIIGVISGVGSVTDYVNLIDK